MYLWKTQMKIKISRNLAIKNDKFYKTQEKSQN